MCNCLSLNNKGKIHYGLLLLVIGILFLLFYMIMEKNILRIVRDKVDNELVIGAFSGSMFDMERLYDSVCVTKIESENVEYDFSEIYQLLELNIDCDKVYDTISGILKDNVKTSSVGGNLIENPKIKKIIVYNMPEYPMAYIFDEGGFYAKSDDFVTPNGVVINKTSIYVKIEFELKGFMGRRRRLYMEKCISLKY